MKDWERGGSEGGSGMGDKAEVKRTPTTTRGGGGMTKWSKILTLAGVITASASRLIGTVRLAAR